MVELQIVILAVAGSSPVGHPPHSIPGRGMCAAKTSSMLNPAILESASATNVPANFWLRFLNDRALNDCNDLEKLLIGCELIAAVDAVDMLAT